MSRRHLKNKHRWKRYFGLNTDLIWNIIIIEKYSNTYSNSKILCNSQCLHCLLLFDLMVLYNLSGLSFEYNINQMTAFICILGDDICKILALSSSIVWGLLVESNLEIWRSGAIIFSVQRHSISALYRFEAIHVKHCIESTFSKHFYSSRLMGCQCYSCLHNEYKRWRTL